MTFWGRWYIFVNRVLVYLILMKIVKNILTNRQKKKLLQITSVELNTVMDIIQATVNN